MNSVTVGEVHTGLLHHSTAIPPSMAAALVDHLPGEPVIRSVRPISLVSSPPMLTGVDCLLPSGNGAKARAVGTVVARTSLTGGHVLQAIAVATVHRGGSDRRQPWSFYLARPGELHTVTRVQLDQIAPGFLDGTRRADQLDLQAIAQRAFNAVQDRPGLDRRAAITAPRMQLRFAIPDAPDQEPSIAFRVGSGPQRTLLLSGAKGSLTAQLEFCADLARHDWLLSTLLTVVDRSRSEAGSRSEVIDRLAPAVDHLLHQWMPAARTDANLLAFWQAVERRPGLTRQWQVNVDRIRDQIALGLLERLGAVQKESAGAHGQ